MRLNVSTNFPEVAQRLVDMGKQAKFAAAVALTQTARDDVKPAIQNEMRRVFDRPTAYTINSMFVKGANKTGLEARVWLKDNPFGKGTPADRYLAPQIFGGERRLKGLERALQAARLMKPNQFAVPAVAAKLDANGNVSRSQIVQVLSQLRAQLGAGYESRASGSARSQATIARQGVTYFAIAEARRGLQPGVYMKRRFAHGTAIKPVFIFVSHATYRPILKFFEVGERVARTAFPGRFDVEMAKAIASARL